MPDELDGIIARIYIYIYNYPCLKARWIGHACQYLGIGIQLTGDCNEEKKRRGQLQMLGPELKQNISVIITPTSKCMFLMNIFHDRVINN
jgi:hypothetical protein